MNKNFTEEDNKLDPYLANVIASSTLAWIKEENIVNEMGVRIRVDADSDYFFLHAIYADISDKIAARKPSQFGLSTWAILSEIHDAKYANMNQIHTLPTQGDVRKFVPTKVDEIIERNIAIRKGMSAIDLGAIGQKQFGSGFVYYTPTFSERTGFIITSDRNWYDEVDRSNQKSIKNYASRLEGQDSLKQERWLSTPTIPGFGIDKVWEESDQKHWRWTCMHCRKRQHMKWPDNIDMDKGVYICSNCGKQIDREWIRPKTEKHPNGTGAWEARFPKRSPIKDENGVTIKDGISGYWFTQMIAPWVTPESLIKEYNENEKEHTLDFFYNHKLGMPFISGDSSISKAIIMRNCLGNKPHLEINSLAGVDVQLNELYVTIGSKEGVYAFAILRHDDEYIRSNGKEGKSKWDRLGEVMEVYDIRYMVIDGGFTPNEVMDFAKKHPGKVWVNWYKDDPKHAKIVRFTDDDFHAKEKQTFEEEVTVLTERDRMIDFLLADLQKGYIRFFFDAESPQIKKLIEHTQTTYARKVTDRIGQESREWVSTGKDDFLHSLIYYRIARMKQEKSEK